MMARPTEVAIVAFGLEHCKRGVEAHARMLFEKLKLEPGISVSLIKGSGKRRKDEVVLSVPKRHTWLNRFLGKLRGYNIYWEQVFFMIRLFFYLVQNARELDYIYTQEYVHMVGLGRLKKVFGWSYDLVYCEGFVSKSETRLIHADILQEVNKTNFDYICPKAESVGKPCHLIPHFFDPIWEDSRQDAPILNEIQYFKGDKRMLLYVGPTELEEKNFERIEEAVQNLGDGWCLLVCGDMDPERLERMNKETGCMTKSVYVAHDIMQRIYPMADLFVLPSVDEAFGIATIEAMGHGIPVLLHHSAHSLWLCNDTEQCTDMTRP
ncbi:MAG: glycosyltransferase family 4 protein, partial [Flavobacteriales bacterium]|nr:glycosyltransferase family 4 protein [Flavobacteriales bacterium]